MDACENIRRRYGKIQVGSAVATLGFGLDVSFIIHAVVPKWRGGKYEEDAMLGTAYLAALDLGDALDCESIAFPLLGSGNNGFDSEQAFRIAKESIELYAPKNKLQKAYMVVYSAQSMALMRKLGVNVLEEIDNKYEMRHDTYQVDPLWDKLDNVKKQTLEFLNKPYVKEVLKESGKEIARKILKGK